MIDSTPGFLSALLSTLRITDLIDVVLVAFFLFVLFSWMRRSMSRSAVRGIGVILAVLAGVFLSARFLEMYLIEQVTTVLLFTILLSAIVAFQADLRRMFDRTGAWLFSRRTTSAPQGTATVDLLVDVAVKLGKARIGALIAIKGAEPWDHHVQGGIDLGGVVSEPLLFSIFDHRTPGHDGALLLEGNRVTRFATHLPLAATTPHVSRYGGTRHAAALGLAEVSDAFVVVVSEERGTISVAQDGTIIELTEPSQLKIRLDEFWQAHYADSHRIKGQLWSRSGLGTAALAVGISALMWSLFAYSPDIMYRSFDVPIEFRGVPQDWRIQEGTKSVEVRLSGPNHAFRLFDPAQLAVTLLLDQPLEGENRLMIDRNDLDLPDRITLEGVDPAAVQVNAIRLLSTLLPVQVPSTGQLPDSLELVSLWAEPDSVLVLIQAGDTLKQLAVEAVHLDSIVATSSLIRTLILPEGVSLPDQEEGEITVHIEVRPRGQGGLHFDSSVPPRSPD